MTDIIFTDLEARIEHLVRTCRKLREENAFLREMQEELEKDRFTLQEKHAQARARVEQIVKQLQQLDVETTL
jgi:uncharacterized protein (TIGR02449 family)